MYQKERIDMIMAILHENGYVNVKYICDKLGYSKATVNRDLNHMKNKNMIIRSYGGVEIAEKSDIPLEFRYHKMKNEKKSLCKAAAKFVKDGDTIFIDSSSTTEFISPYLVKKNNLTVITSNIAVVAYLSNFPNINIICLGGKIIEPPSMLGGDLCVKNAMTYKADILFFATHGINERGELGCTGPYNLLLNTMAQNSQKVVYLADRTKVNLTSKTVVMTADNVDVIISDYTFDEAFKRKFKNVEFIEVK